MIDYDPLPYDDQQVYRVTVSVPVPDLTVPEDPDWKLRQRERDWEYLLSKGSICYITKGYRIRGKRLTITCDVPIRDRWDGSRGRKSLGSAEHAIAAIGEAVRFDVAWVLGLTNTTRADNPALTDLRASARYLRTVPANRAEYERRDRVRQEVYEARKEAKAPSTPNNIVLGET